MKNEFTKYCLVINYSIEAENLRTEVSYPANFLTMDDGTQVQFISGIIDMLNSTEIPGAAENMSLDKAHKELVEQCSMLFPFSSSLTLNVNNISKEVLLDFVHDASVASIEPFHQMVLVDSIIKVMKATAISIVRKAEKAETAKS